MSKDVRAEARKEYNYRRIIELIFLVTGKVVLTAHDVKLLLGISESTLGAYIKNGKAPKRIEKAGKTLFAITSVAAWILDDEPIEDFILRLDRLESADGTDWNPCNGAERVKQTMRALSDKR